MTEQEFAAQWSTRPLTPLSPLLKGLQKPAAILETQTLSHVYGADLPHEKESLTQVSAQFTPGSIHAIIGASGSGKTTFAQHLNGLLRPGRGRVLLDGEDLQSQPQLRVHQRVGLVFQFPESQLFAETVQQDVAFGPNNAGFSEKRVSELVDQALSQVGLPLESFGSRPPLSLSGEKSGALL